MSIATVADVLAATALRAQLLIAGQSPPTPAGAAGWLGMVQRATSGNLIPSSAFTTTPTTGSGATCDRSTTGAIALPTDPASSRYFRLLAARQTYQRGFLDGALLLCDRLVHAGGLNTNTASEQVIDTVALPSRATGGDGVLMAFELLAQPSGGTSPTVSVNYTNQAGTTAHTATSAAIGSSWGSPNPNTKLILPFQAGDTGARAIHSVTISSASSGSASCCVSLFKPICWLPMYAGRSDDDWLDAGLAKIDPQACLEVDSLWLNAPGAFQLELALVIDG